MYFSFSQRVHQLHLHVFDQLVDNQSSVKNFIKIVCKIFFLIEFS